MMLFSSIRGQGSPFDTISWISKLIYSQKSLISTFRGQFFTIMQWSTRKETPPSQTNLIQESELMTPSIIPIKKFVIHFHLLSNASNIYKNKGSFTELSQPNLFYFLKMEIFSWRIGSSRAPINPSMMLEKEPNCLNQMMSKLLVKLLHRPHVSSQWNKYEKCQHKK